MRKALTISAIGHAVLLLWGMVTFVVKPLEANTAESLPIDVISDAEFSQITAGMKTAKKTDTPKPLVEKLGEQKPVEELTKVDKKPPIQTASAEPMPIPPEPKKPETKPQQAKAEPAPPKPEPEKAKPTEAPQPDPIAEAMKKAEEQKKVEEQKKKAEEQKKKLEEQKKKAEEQKRKEQQQRDAFDPSKIAALLDKQAPRREAATGDTLNQTASLGLASGRAATLSQSEIDALRAQIQACWNPPAGAIDGKELIVQVRLRLRQDGSLQADPTLMNRGSHPFFQVAAESALRAIRRCQPYRLPVAKYDVWKDVEVTFDPRDMFRG